MNNYYGIRYELQVIREELRARLFEHSMFEMTTDDHVKNNTLIHHIKEELQDVERALLKMDKGIYGYCEESGDKIPYDKLRILPTARTIYDFYFQELFERKSLPQFDYTYDESYYS